MPSTGQGSVTGRWSPRVQRSRWARAVQVPQWAGAAEPPQVAALAPRPAAEEEARAPRSAAAEARAPAAEEPPQVAARAPRWSPAAGAEEEAAQAPQGARASAILVVAGCWSPSTEAECWSPSTCPASTLSRSGTRPAAGWVRALACPSASWSATARPRWTVWGRGKRSTVLPPALRRVLPGSRQQLRAPSLQTPGSPSQVRCWRTCRHRARSWTSRGRRVGPSAQSGEGSSRADSCASRSGWSRNAGGSRWRIRSSPPGQ